MTICRIPVFPFGAIVGLERVKLSLMLCAINPAIGGTLIVGERGTGKSTSVRGLADLLLFEKHDIRHQEESHAEIQQNDGSFCNPNLVEIGPGKDIEELSRTMESCGEHLIIHLNNMEKIREEILNIVFEKVETDTRRRSVEGRLPRFIVLGTSNNTGILDGHPAAAFFGLCSKSVPVEELEDRYTVMRLSDAFERNPSALINKYMPDQEMLFRRITRAREILKSVETPEPLMKRAAAFLSSSGITSHNADMTLIRTARTIAAFGGRKRTEEDDMMAAIELAMPHRVSGALSLNKAGAGTLSEKLGSIWRDSAFSAARGICAIGEGISTQAASEISEKSINERGRARKAGTRKTSTASRLGSSAQGNRTGGLLLVIVADTSGRHASSRSGMISSAVPAILDALPGKNDRISLVTVSGRTAEITFPPGSDRNEIAMAIEKIPRGGKTPLPDGLTKALSLIRNEIRTDPGIHPLLAVLTDGRANVSDNGNVMHDLEEAAEAISKKGFRVIVVNPDGNESGTGLAKSLAKKMRAEYFPMNSEDPDGFVEIVKEKLLK